MSNWVDTVSIGLWNCVKSIQCCVLSTQYAVPGTREPSETRLYRSAILTFALLGSALVANQSHAANEVQSFSSTVGSVQPKMVKLYGAGGLRGLEAYQSGLLISADGHILTVWSYVLDTDEVTVVLNDGRRFAAEILGSDPRLEIAVLKVDATELPHFELSSAVELQAGSRVLAFSNVFAVATGNEPVSVLHGCVSANTKLSARRGAYVTTYQGSAYVLDAMTNNPGAAGGALTDRQGRLAGLLGKELRNSLDNTWLNYAMPIPELDASVGQILSGTARVRSEMAERRKPIESVDLTSLGIVLVPNVVAKTPAYIDRILPDSPAHETGLQPDDLILFVNDQVLNSSKQLRSELEYIDRIDEVRLLVQRGQELIDVSLFVE
ncbi:MAG: serine protease [Planctomycetaceae bacterium]|nr:serine protease [Planctomycetaceae bacterium]